MAEPWEGLEEMYLAAADARGGSGFRGDAARWERGRRVIVNAIDRDGTFLDVGCANGLLMQSLRRWAAKDGHAIDPYGLDASGALVDLARARLPAWADRFFVGDARRWTEPAAMRFDFVRTELEYAVPDNRPALIRHLLHHVVAPGGRLIVCAYGKASAGVETVEPAADLLRAWGHSVAGEVDAHDTNGVRLTRVAWLDASGRT
jgi:SAM-dependent methyltransferase